MSRSKRARWKRPALGIGATVLVAAVSLVVLRACSTGEGAEPITRSSARPDLEATSPGDETPDFERPEEAKRYAEAVTAGDTRAIALLDDALRKAREQPTPDTEAITRLEQARAARQRRLETHDRARR